MADDDRPGYCNPPRHSRFPPGKSGNPGGRPRGSRGLKNELRAELDEWVTITVDGKSKRIRKRRLILKALAAKAAKGDVRAADKLLSMVIQAEGFEDQRPQASKLSDIDQRILDEILGNDAAGEAEPSKDNPEGEAPSEGESDNGNGD